MKYKVIYERDEDGWWVACVEGVPGCHTQGKTIAQARNRIKEALELFVEDLDDAEIIDQVKLPSGIRRLLNRVYSSRKRLHTENACLSSITADAAIALTQELGISVRDAGELLGLSHQRVQQIVSSKRHA